MRARVITTKASSDIVEAGVQLTRDVLVPNARQYEGYRGYVAIHDAARGVGIAVTLWEDEASEEASDEAIRPSREQMAEQFGAEVVVDKYDVAIAEVID